MTDMTTIDFNISENMYTLIITTLVSILVTVVAVVFRVKLIKFCKRLIRNITRPVKWITGRWNRHKQEPSSQNDTNEHSARDKTKNNRNRQKLYNKKKRSRSATTKKCENIVEKSDVRASVLDETQDLYQDEVKKGWSHKARPACKHKDSREYVNIPEKKLLSNQTDPSNYTHMRGRGGNAAKNLDASRTTETLPSETINIRKEITSNENYVNLIQTENVCGISTVNGNQTHIGNNSVQTTVTGANAKKYNENEIIDNKTTEDSENRKKNNKSFEHNKSKSEDVVTRKSPPLEKAAGTDVQVISHQQSSSQDSNHQMKDSISSEKTVTPSHKNKESFNPSKESTTTGYDNFKHTRMEGEMLDLKNVDTSLKESLLAKTSLIIKEPQSCQENSIANPFIKLDENTSSEIENHQKPLNLTDEAQKYKDADMNGENDNNSGYERKDVQGEQETAIQIVNGNKTIMKYSEKEERFPDKMNAENQLKVYLREKENMTTNLSQTVSTSDDNAGIAIKSEIPSSNTKIIGTEHVDAKQVIVDNIEKNLDKDTSESFLSEDISKSLNNNNCQEKNETKHDTDGKFIINPGQKNKTAADETNESNIIGPSKNLSLSNINSEEIKSELSIKDEITAHTASEYPETIENKASENNISNSQPASTVDNESAQFLDVHEYFREDYLKNIDNEKDNRKKIDFLLNYAKQFENQVKNFNEEKYSLEYFVLDEKLMKIIEKLDQIRCYQDEALTNNKVEVIEYIKELQVTLDHKAEEAMA